jgi:uncharacterized membrane protein YfcA
MSTAEALLVLVAGFAAGTINTIVGSGTLITFPVLLAVGYGPVVANVSNTLGLVPGSVAGAIGYRAELAGQRGRVLRYCVASALGGLVGGILLLSLPDEAFAAIVPVLIALALVLVVAQPRLSAALKARRERAAKPHGGPVLMAGIFGTGVYGGYFGAAQGIILLALMGISMPDDLQRLNAIKNVLAGLVNAVAAILFIVVAPVAWEPAALIALGAVVGGVVGARVGRRLSPAVLRGIIVVVGVAAIVQLVL